jgi:hypothetical protein
VLRRSPEMVLRRNPEMVRRGRRGETQERRCEGARLRS